MLSILLQLDGLKCPKEVLPEVDLKLLIQDVSWEIRSPLLSHVILSLPCFVCAEVRGLDLPSSGVDSSVINTDGWIRWVL